MEIEKFIAARKKMGLSQQELAKGICTQATVSRFERNGKIPSLKILTQLCQRVGLAFEDIFPKMNIQKGSLEEILEKIEFQLITSEYQEAFNTLSQINFQELKDHEKNHYLYLKGFLTVLLDLDITEALFDFNQILVGKTAETDLYTLLAYTGLGLAYFHHEDLEKTNFYFDKVFAEVQKVQPKEMMDIWQVLTILFHLSLYYYEMKQYQTSDALLKQALTICKENHVTYYVARIFLQLAENAIAQKREISLIKEYLADAWSFSKFNNNVKEIEKLKKLWQDYQG